MILIVISKSYILLYSRVWFKNTKLIQFSLLLNIFPLKKAAFRNKKKLVALTRGTQEKHPRIGQSRNTSVPRINEEYKTQVFEEIGSRVTKKLSQEFSRTKSCILSALSKIDEFLLNPQVWTQSGTVPGTCRKTDAENQERIRMVPRIILILKWDPPSIGLITQFIQTKTRLVTKYSSRSIFEVFF